VEDRDVCFHQQGVQQVEEDYPVIIVQQLVGEVGQVACQHDPEKDPTFPRRGTGFPRADNRERPGRAKTDKHQDLERTHDPASWDNGAGEVNPVLTFVSV
jgi:hypothetical protein